MLLRRLSLSIPLAALAACGGGTIRVADDDGSSGDAPVALAPTPEPEPTASPAPQAVSDSAAIPETTAVPREQGYAPYGGGSTLEFRRIGQWSHTGIGERRRLVIRDANSWAEFWSELGAGDRPDVDFTKAVVVAVAAGQHPSGGYEVAVEQVTQTNGELQVHVVETSPGPNCLTGSSLTQPVDVVVVPIVAPRSWGFVERKDVRGCR